MMQSINVFLINFQRAVKIKVKVLVSGMTQDLKSNVFVSEVENIQREF